MRQPITDSERKKVLAVLEKRERVERPLKEFSGLLLTDFGWPPSTGRKRSILILKELERDGKINCLYDKRPSLQSVWMVKTSPPEEAGNSATPPTNTKITVTAATPRGAPKQKVLPKGVLRKIRKRKDRGEQNEARFHRLTLRLLELLKSLPLGVMETSSTRSGRHNPKNGKVDLKDCHGEDINLQIAMPLEQFRLIYDTKTSRADAERFNRRVRYYREQTNANLKKAIVVNKTRTDAEVIEEVMKDIISVGFPISEEHQKTVAKTLEMI